MPTINSKSDSTKTVILNWTCVTRDLFAWLRAIKRHILLINRNFRLIIATKKIVQGCQ